jgi:hypothetical protein
MTDYANLVDQDAIDAAARRLSELTARHAEAVADVPATARVLAAAKAAHVAVTLTNGDPKATKRAVVAAAAEAELAVEMVEAIEAAVAQFRNFEMPVLVARAHDAYVASVFADLRSTAEEHDQLEAAVLANSERAKSLHALLNVASGAGHAAARGYVNLVRVVERQPAVASRGVDAEAMLQGGLV